MKEEIIQKEFEKYQQRLDELRIESSKKTGWFHTIGDTEQWKLQFRECRIMSNILLIILKSL